MGTPIWKEVLCLGAHVDPATGEVCEFKPRHIQEAHRNFQKMFRRGVPLPAIWEHQKFIEAGNAPATPEKIAEWKRQYARYTFCHPNDSRINKRGNLELLHPVEDEEDAKQLKKTKFVSPKVYRNGYWDSKGGTYDGTTIAHVAATPTPVQFWQKPFELSDSDALFLSYTPPEAEPDAGESAEPCPDSDVPFDAWLDDLDRAVELSATEPPEEPPVADEKPTEEKPKGDDKGDKGGEKNADLKMIIDAIKQAYPAANIPDEVSNWSELALVLKAQAGAAEPEPEPEPAPDADGGTEAAPGGPPMLMSTLDKNPQKRERARKYAKPERDDVLARIAAAARAGRDPRQARQLTRRAGAVEMSFTTDYEAAGPTWGKLLADVAAYEKSDPVVKFKADGSVDLSATTLVEKPKLDDKPDEDSPEAKAVRERQAQIAARLSIRPAK